MSLNNPQPMRALFGFLRHYKGALWSSVGSSITNKIFDLMPPFMTAWIIDAVSGDAPNWLMNGLGIKDTWQQVIWLIVLTVIVFALESFFEWLYKRGFLRLAQRVQHDLRIKAYEKLQSREMAFFESERVGNLMAILNDDVNQQERFLNSVFNEIIQMTTLVIFAGISLFSLSWEIGCISMLPIPFIIWGSVYYQRSVAPHYKAVREGVGALATRLENNLSGMLVIKSFTSEDSETERVRQASSTYRDANYRAIRWIAVYNPLIRMLILVGFAGALLLGAYWVVFAPAKFSLGNLAFVAMMTQRLLWPVTRLGFIFDEFERSRSGARRIFGLLDSEPAIVSVPESDDIKDSFQAGTFSFREVDFGYQPDHLILQNFNLEIPAGKVLGIAGSTGGGKTTLIKLLLRLYDPLSGDIQIDGQSLRDIPVPTLRSNIALVSQDVYLFHGTILENIKYGRPDSSISEVQEIAKRVKLHDFILGLPEQYNTIIGERGIKLSGGQRQRISIARALLKDAPILILDEATSAVDTETERAIQENIELLTAGKTAIIIAHRLSTIKAADHIVVLENGKAVERGSHEELLALRGQYADLWEGITG